MIFGKGS